LKEKIICRWCSEPINLEGGFFLLPKLPKEALENLVSRPTYDKGDWPYEMYFEDKGRCDAQGLF